MQCNEYLNTGGTLWLRTILELGTTRHRVLPTPLRTIIRHQEKDLRRFSI
jgi:hypothetical protein